LLIIEIVEQSPYFNSARMRSAVADLRSLGVAIAVDDVGLGHGNFRTILDTSPEYLKIDRYFVAGVADDPRRRSIISSAVRIARDFGALVVAEGIEDPADLATLRELDITLMQGYLLGMPASNPNLATLNVDMLAEADGRQVRQA
jgi:EAL domain-containing protein (putative c-di-GMP-specific phosphodiesterase class I)